MAYLGEYIGVGWENEPSQRTPVNAYNLGIMEDGIKRLFAYLIAGGGIGPGTNGREIELRNSGEYIQWRYSGEEDWTNLVALADLKGKDGDNYVLTDEDIEEIASKVKVATSADKITYDDTETKLGAENVQDAIGKLSEQIVNLTGRVETLEKNGAGSGTTGITFDYVTEEIEDETVILESISASYSGGSVLVGTDVSDLTGIVVTANYSDGSTATVTDYTLSGTITKGSNTVTINYEEMTTTITVIGYTKDEEITLTDISASYTGGDVPVGTALTSLTGITVTGIYSDGSTSSITGYTLSGEIAEGNNTITVSYSGLTCTFTVTGIAESIEPTYRNLFDKDTMVTENQGIVGTGVIGPYTWGLARVPVKENTKYSIKTVTNSMLSGGQSTQHYYCGATAGAFGFADETGNNLISFISLATTQEQVDNNTNGANDLLSNYLIDDGDSGYITFTTPIGCAYLLFNTTLKNNANNIQLEEGDTIHNYYLPYTGGEA